MAQVSLDQAMISKSDGIACSDLLHDSLKDSAAAQVQSVTPEQMRAQLQATHLRFKLLDRLMESKLDVSGLEQVPAKPGHRRRHTLQLGTIGATRARACLLTR